MKYFIYSILLVFIFNSFVFCQDTDKTEINKATLLFSLQPEDEDLAEAIYIIGEQAKSKMQSKQDVLAIRVCSKLPLPFALSGSYGNPFLTADLLTKNYSISKNNIYYLRQETNCEMYNSALTEFWFVPENADLPEFVEFKRATDLFSQTITTRGYIYRENETSRKLNPQLFQQTLDIVVDRLRKNRTIFVLINFSSPDKKTKSEVAKRSIETKEYLQKKGISSYRIILNRCIDEEVEDSKENSYPTIIIVGENLNDKT